MSDYLWDKTGEPEADVAELENLLGTLKYQPRPLEIPASAMPTASAATARPSRIFFSRPRLAVAASLLLTLLAGMWFVTRQGEPRKDQVAQGTTASETGGGRLPEQPVATNGAGGGNDAPAREAEVNDTAAPKPREATASIVPASAAKPRRAPRASDVRGRKLQPRRSIEAAPAPRELVAANGARWEVEQPLTPEQRKATEQLMLALQLASAKFNYAQREMQEIGRAGK